jgi:hypothetical protein
MLMPRQVLAVTGSFDERFFMYGEDIDLSYRVQQAGYKNYYIADIAIIHFKGESTKRGSLNYVRLFYSAMSVFVKKHYGNGKANLFTFLIQIAIGFRAFIAGIARFFARILPAIRKTKAEQAQNNPQAITIIVAGEKEQEAIKQLIQRSGIPKSIRGRVGCGNNDEAGTLGNIQQLNELVKQYSVTEIIFCENGLSYRSIIECIQKLPAGLGYWFHASRSNSMVGSNDKDNRGDYIAARD